MGLFGSPPSFLSLERDLAGESGRTPPFADEQFKNRYEPAMNRITTAYCLNLAENCLKPLKNRLRTA